jgi:spore coat polysaccharide biosynthesis predicted glycosyltransferase SpsG
MFNQLIILTEAGAEIGFGHFTRCCAIYKAATEKKINCKLFVFENKVNLNDSNLNSNNWLHDLSVVLNESKNSLVLIDSYLAQNIHYKTLKEHLRTMDNYFVFYLRLIFLESQEI